MRAPRSLLLPAAALLLLAPAAAAECSFRPTELPDAWNPLLLLLRRGAELPPDGRGVLRPGPDGLVRLAAGDRISVLCGERMVRGGPGRSVPQLAVEQASCLQGTTFTLKGGPTDLSELRCPLSRAHTARRVAGSSGGSSGSGVSCAGDRGTLLEVGFELGRRFLRLYTSCFDETAQAALYTNASATCHQGQGDRPGFLADFHSPSPQALYTLTEQKKTFGDQAISRDQYFEKGHLAPNADFLYNAERDATFYYFNTAPQWNRLNKGNWSNVERWVRERACEYGDLRVVTGTLGVAGQGERRLFMDQQRGKVPVPALFWKVAVDAQRRRGVALVAVNSPEAPAAAARRPPHPSLAGCSRQLCYSVDPVAFQYRGWVFCCRVDGALRAALPGLEDLPDLQLLGSAAAAAAAGSRRGSGSGGRRGSGS